MWGWIGLCALGVVTVVGLYSALVMASHEDDRAEEYYRKHQKEEAE